MLDLFAGIVTFLLLFIAKRTLVSVLLSKKQVALSVAIIVLSELLLMFVLYISIYKYRLSGIKLFIGFLMSMTVMIGFYCYRFLAKGSERIDDGKL